MLSFTQVYIHWCKSLDLHRCDRRIWQSFANFKQLKKISDQLLQLATVVSIHNVFVADGTAPRLVNETKNFAYCVQLETVTEPKTATIKTLRFL